MLIETPNLTLRLSISRTAHLFHVVDQLSAWSEFTHAQYRRWFGAQSSTDRHRLDEHKEIRTRRGWGGGLEQSFYTDADLREALQAAVRANRLDPAEAATELEVLLHFETAVDALIATELPTLERFRQRVWSERSTLAAFAAQVARLCQCPTITVSGFLIANPADWESGGGFNGSMLTLEVARKADTYPILLHELMHAFLELSGANIHLRGFAAQIGCPFETLNEGICYALSPGLFSADQRVDSLQRDVNEDREAGKPMSDSYTRFRRFGLALRPYLQQALGSQHGTITDVVARAGDAWRSASRN